MQSVTPLAHLCGKNNTSLGELLLKFTTLLRHTLMAISNRVPWAIITACFVVSAALLLVLRFMLASENRRRDTEQRDGQYDDVYVKQGSNVETKVDKVYSKPS